MNHADAAAGNFSFPAHGRGRWRLNDLLADKGMHGRRKMDKSFFPIFDYPWGKFNENLSKVINLTNNFQRHVSRVLLTGPGRAAGAGQEWWGLGWSHGG